jgi:polysaccharide pyruvyl transferase WcaK-like protein
VSAGPVVALWGTFDVDNFGDHLFPRIARMELDRRGCRIRTYAPMGWAHPTHMDGGDPSEPLGAYEPSRLDRLAAVNDAVLVGGGEIIHMRDELLAPHYGVTAEEARKLGASRFFIEGLGPAREQACPLLWHAVGIPFDASPSEAACLATAVADRPYVAVRDEVSRRRLAAAGVERNIAVVADSGFLIPRLLRPEVLEKRLAYLRVMGWFPADGPVVVVQGNRDLTRFAGDIATALRALTAERPELTITLLETGNGHGDHEFAEALSHHLEGKVARMPSSTGIEDIAAAIAAAELFVGISFHGNVTAAAFGRPHVILNLNGQSKLDGLANALHAPERLVVGVDSVADAMRRNIDQGPRPDVVRALQAGIDEHFDRVADIADRSAVARGGAGRPATVTDPEVAALRWAHDRLTRRIVAERVAMADRVVDLEQRLAGAAADTIAADARATHLANVLDATEAAVAFHEAERAAIEAELQALHETKTLRWTAPIRNVWADWLRHKP